ncbi:bifunctional metallophosphatase/5'-nucleotidase [Microbacteriaceae bacterium 4G12]
MLNNQQRATVTILETSDIHGTVFPINYGNNNEAEVGIAKISTLIAKERAKGDAVIVIDNGDLIQGTPLTYHYAKYLQHEKNPMSLILQQIGYDAAVIGNHEFNYGMTVLNKAIDEAQVPYLSANILNKQTNEPYFGTPFMMKTTEQGIRVAILGVTTHYIPNWENPSHIEELAFEDTLATTKKWVQYIRDNEKPDVLIVSYHGGFERDLETGEPTEPLTGENQGYAMCQEIEGIDILLTGHQHRSLADLKVNGVTIVQPGCNGQALGKVHIALVHDGERWHIEECHSELLSVEGVQADEAVLALAAMYEKETQEWLDQPIGKIEGDMLVQDPLQTRLQDNALIEFINKVQMDVADVSIANTALFNNEAPGFKPNITMRDIVSNYIYPNTLKVIRVTGQDIKDALEQSAEYFTLNDKGNITVSPAFLEPKPQHYNYDMWEGIEYILNISKPVGERVVSLQYSGNPIRLDEEFDVVMNNYRAGGGGNYMMYQNKPVIKEIPMDMSELLTSYILERGTIEATVNHNWKVITE